MPVTRTYLCDDCSYRFTQLHMSRDEAAPDCPSCYAATHSVPGGFNITGNKSKAMDMVQKIAEEDYGLTNMRDGARDGEVAAMGPSHVQSAEAEQLTRQMMDATPQMAPHQAEAVNAFWKNSMSGSPSQAPAGPQMTPEARRDILLAQGAAASSQSSGLSADPVGLLHEAGKRGMADTRLEILNPASTRSMKQ